MKIALTHTRNPLMGWDISVSVSGEAAEAVAFVSIAVNDFPEVSETVDPPVGVYTHTLTQKGDYPGDNKVAVDVQDQDGNEHRALDVW